MHADTDAIRAYGGATTKMSAELHAAGALLARDLGPTVAAAFGPVGVRFVAALTDAAMGLRTAVTGLGDDVTAAGEATTSAARDFDDVEFRSREELAQVGM